MWGKFMVDNYYECEILERVRVKHKKPTLQKVIDEHNAEQKRADRLKKKTMNQQRRSDRVEKFVSSVFGGIIESVERSRAKRAFQKECKDRYDAYQDLYNENLIGYYQKHSYEEKNGTKGKMKIIHSPRGPIVISLVETASGKKIHSYEGYFTSDAGKTYMYGRATRCTTPLGYSIAGIGAENISTDAVYRDNKGKFHKWPSSNGVNTIYAALRDQADKGEYYTYDEINLDEPVKE